MLSENFIDVVDPWEKILELSTEVERLRGLEELYPEALNQLGEANRQLEHAATEWQEERAEAERLRAGLVAVTETTDHGQAFAIANAVLTPFEEQDDA